jgi:hypothetical protein
MHSTQVLFLTSMLAWGQHSPVAREAQSHLNGSVSLTSASIRRGKPLETLIIWLTYSRMVSLKSAARIGYRKNTAAAAEALLCVYVPQSRKTEEEEEEVLLLLLLPGLDAATENRLSHRLWLVVRNAKPETTHEPFRMMSTSTGGDAAD